MNQNEIDPPTTQRQFATSWGELDYLCKKVRYWLYDRKRKTKARYFLNRLERVLHELPANNMAIIREEGMALLCELKGNIGESMLHRKREIRLMERLHKESQRPRYDEKTKAYMLRDRDGDALKIRRAILESLAKMKPSIQERRNRQKAS